MASRKMRSSTPTLSRREANKSDKLKRIREAAKRVILEKGFENATVREIAEVAGVAFGTIFLYASDKQDLLLMIFEEDLSRLREKALKRVRKDASFPDQLIAFLTPIYTFFLATPQLSRDMLREVQFSEGIVAKRIGRDMAEFEHSIAEIVSLAQTRGILRGDVSSVFIAQLLFGLHRMQMRLCIATERPDKRACLKTLREQFELVLDGLKPV